MFHRHFEEYVRHGRHGRHGHGPWGWRARGGGFGPREGRMFDQGELKLVILALIAEKPRHGYEVIKELAERVGGDYSPSPGVVYPTLTMLEEMGFATASQDEQGRKLYAVTPEGEKQLADAKPQVDAIFAPLQRAGGGARARRHGLGHPRHDEPARRDPPSPARPGREPRADPGDRRRARRGGEADREDLRRRADVSRAHHQGHEDHQGPSCAFVRLRALRALRGE